MSHRDFEGRAMSIIAPSHKFVGVDPADDADLPEGPCRGLFVDGAGVLIVRDLSGRVARFTSGDSQYHPIRVSRVEASGTTATGIVALY